MLSPTTTQVAESSVHCGLKAKPRAPKGDRPLQVGDREIDEDLLGHSVSLLGKLLDRPGRKCIQAKTRRYGAVPATPRCGPQACGHRLRRSVG